MLTRRGIWKHYKVSSETHALGWELNFFFLTDFLETRVLVAPRVSWKGEHQDAAERAGAQFGHSAGRGGGGGGGGQ